MAFKKSRSKDGLRLGTDDSPTSGSDRPADERDKSAQENPFLGSTTDHVFSDPAIASHWQLKYEKAGYENRHRFDPEFQWTAEEEKKLVHKVGLYLDADRRI